MHMYAFGCSLQATSDEPQATSNEPRASSNDSRATSNERDTSNEPRATSTEPQATSIKRNKSIRAICDSIAPYRYVFHVRILAGRSNKNSGTEAGCYAYVCIRLLVTSHERRTTSHEQRALSHKQRASKGIRAFMQSVTQ